MRNTCATHFITGLAMYNSPPTTFAALISPYPASVRTIAEWLRAELLREFPQLQENVSGGLRSGTALYSVGEPERVAVGVQPGDGFVKFFLHDHSLIPAGRFRLEGSGKHSRHIKLRDIPETYRDELMELARIPIERRSVSLADRSVVSDAGNPTPLQSRLYTPEDFPHVLALFDSNVPEFFTPPERTAFVEFLHDLPGPYYVIESGNSLVASGGYAIVTAEARADLCWGMVERSLHGRGIGRCLTELRVNAARRDPQVRRIILNTSQHTQAFYERLGFITERVTEDGFGLGLHRCDMRLELG